MKKELTLSLNEEKELEFSLPLEKELIYWIKWLIKLRWIAVIMLIVITLGVRFLLRIFIPVIPLLIIGGVVILYNTFFTQYASHLRESRGNVHTFHNFANFQVSIDWIILAFLIHYTGGIESPLIFYFVLHIVISAILLSRRNCLLQAVFASGIIVAVTIMEYKKILPHISSPILMGNFYNHPFSIFTYLFFFITGFFVITYLTSSVSVRLRERERKLLILERNLEKAYHKLEEAGKVKSYFVTMITHELRSPVSTIESILSRLREGYAGKLTVKQKEYIERIKRRIDYILALINDLLTLTAEERETIREKHPVDIKKVLKEVCESMQTLVEQKKIRFEVKTSSLPLSIEGDEEEVGLLFSNLINNALKYTPPEGKVQVKVTEEKEGVKIEVIDTGIGIAKEDQEKIFNEFYRAPNAKKMVHEGTGLGLPIVKKIVESYGGKIQIQSELGKGCRFICSLKERI